MDISSMLEVQVKEMKTEVDVKENVTPREQAQMPGTTDSASISSEELRIYYLIFNNDISSVRLRRIHCTACDTHIGSAPSQIHNMMEHPVLRTLLCAKCREFYGDGSFEQGDDATDMFCRWCANGGNLYCCSYCSNTFCYKCIRINFSPAMRQKIEADEKWKCFVCNPSELYSARALCWALLQHVRTVRRVLMTKTNASLQEIEIKMNIDESRCCTRRGRRRGRRRIYSISEEEDEYMPDELPIIMKRKKMKKSNLSVAQFNYQSHLHFASTPFPIRPRPMHFSESNIQSLETEAQFLYSQEPVEHETPAIPQSPSEGILITSTNTMNSDETPLASFYEPNAMQLVQPTLYHTTIMNHAAMSSTYIRPPMLNSMAHQIILPPPSSSSSLSSSQSQSQSQTQTQTQTQTQQVYHQPAQSLQPASNTMMSIQSSKESRHIPPLLRLSKSKKSKMTSTPSIIDLDSDSDDEPRVVEQHNYPMDANMSCDVSSNKVVPVALVSTENGGDSDESNAIRVVEQPLREMSTTLEKQPILFKEMMLPHSQELDKLLHDVKERICSFFVLSDDEVIKDVELMTHRQIKQFHRDMRDAVFQLACMNDRIVREYSKWQKSQQTMPLIEQEASTPQKSIEIPLDMTCDNESDIESDYKKSEYQVINASKLVQISNIVKDLLFIKKDVVHRGVGDTVLSCENKAVQVNNIVPKDYEQYIACSSLSKTDFEPKTKNSHLIVSTDSVQREPIVSSANFGTYEEQFISYLQNIENQSIKKKQMIGLINSDGTSLANSIDANTCSLELPRSVNSLVESADQSRDCNQEENSELRANSAINDNTAIIADDPASAAKKNEITWLISDRIKLVRFDKTHNGVANKKSMSALNKILNIDAKSRNNIGNTVNTEMMGSEEDCAIIDD